VILAGKKHPPPIWHGYLFGLAGVTLLILLGGGHHVFALSFSLLLPGVALLRDPPRQSPGIWVDRFALAFLAGLLLAFLPQFYWPDPEWRIAAVEQFEINLPASLSVQPLLSLEAWLSALAGLAWFYVAASWQINYTGRRRFYLVFSLLVGMLALVVLWGNHQGIRYPGAETAEFFSFFPDTRQTASFLAVAGVVTLGYAMTALGTRQVVPALGFVAFCLCCFALVVGLARSGGLVLLVGLLICYLLQLKFGLLPKVVKRGFPLFLLILSPFVLNLPLLPVKDGDPALSSMEARTFQVASDVLTMIQDAPLTGHGVGNFSAVFPQYRSDAAVAQPVQAPDSDVLWFMAEAGLLGLFLLGGLLLAYFARCVGFNRGPSGSYRLVALAALTVFILNAAVDVSGHQPGTVYFAILLAALALPATDRVRASFHPGLWRICGGTLVLFGLAWGLAGLTGLPLNSKVALAQYQAVTEDGGSSSAGDAWIARQPMNWRAYHQRAMQTLSDSGDMQAAAADFDRARFVEPTLGAVALEEGFAWVPYDASRALAAWREVFTRKFEVSKGAYARMLVASTGEPDLLAGLSELSKLDLEFRVKLLQFLSGDDLMQELRGELQSDPDLSAYTLGQRSAILEKWIHAGDKQTAERFLRENESGLNRPWWLWSLLRKEQAQFADAVAHIRGAIAPPDLPEVTLKWLPLDRLEHEFEMWPGDMAKGTDLLRRYIEQGNYQKIRDMTEAMIAAKEDVPKYVIYWHAESYYHLQDYIESWFQYEKYLGRLWGATIRSKTD
jgi:O-antigen ligase